jgi:hypothetical protein
MAESTMWRREQPHPSPKSYCGRHSIAWLSYRGSYRNIILLEKPVLHLSSYIGWRLDPQSSRADMVSQFGEKYRVPHLQHTRLLRIFLHYLMALAVALTTWPQKSTLTSPTSGGRSVGIVRSRDEVTEFGCLVLVVTLTLSHNFLDSALVHYAYWHDD